MKNAYFMEKEFLTNTKYIKLFYTSKLISCHGLKSFHVDWKSETFRYISKKMFWMFLLVKLSYLDRLFLILSPVTAILTHSSFYGSPC